MKLNVNFVKDTLQKVTKKQKNKKIWQFIMKSLEKEQLQNHPDSKDQDNLT